MNHVCLTGRLGQDPEIKYFNSGACLAKLSLAVDNPATGKDGSPSWLSLEIWDKTAEVCANYCKKGSLIGVEGSLKLESWTDPQGTLRVKPVIHVSRFHLLEKKPQSEVVVPAPQSPFPQVASIALANF